MSERPMRQDGVPSETAQPGVLHGRWLTVARAAWVAVAALVFSLDALSAPFYYVRIQEVCASAACADDANRLTPERLHALHELTISLVSVYFSLVVALQDVLRALTGQNSQLVIVASTLVIAALFNPLRRRVQVVVDRRFYSRKYDAAKTLEEFGASLREEVDLKNLTGELVAVVEKTIQPAHASLWLPEREESTKMQGSS
jgi:hypothetical protein